MLSNHSQLIAVWISPYINIIVEVSLYKCTHQCCIYHLYRHLRIHSKKSASRYAVQMKVEKSRTNIIVKQTWWDIEWLTGTPAIDGGNCCWLSSANQDTYGTIYSAPAIAKRVRWHHPWIPKRLGDSLTNRFTMYPVYCPLTLEKAFTDQCCYTAFVRHSECCWCH